MLRTRTLAALVLAIATVAAPALAADVTWRVDPNHSSAEFGIKHFALSSVKGAVPIKEGALVLADGKDIPSHIDAVLDISKIDTKQENRDKDLRSPNWFDTDKFPLATFKSTKIDGNDPKKFSITGDLTMHGVTKPITFEGHLEGRGQGSRGEKRIAYTANALVHREDWGLSDAHTNPVGDLVVAKDADVSFSIEAIIPAPPAAPAK
jgi:polyisoprenoid-binding protein YceI